MDKVDKTLFEAILIKLERIENLLINKQKSKSPINKTPGIRYATDAQIGYARRLGADPWEGITHEEISKMIDVTLERKNSTQTVDPQIVDTTGMSEKEINKLKKQLEEVIEPKDVDTENAGIDESGLM